MASDSHLFHSRGELEEDGWALDGNLFRRGAETCLPLYEGKMIWQLDHRFGTYVGQTQAQANKGFLPQPSGEEKADPGFVVLPRHWVHARDVDACLGDKWPHNWLVGWRDITMGTNERTMVASFLPRVAVGHTLPLILADATDATAVACLVANLNSFVFDYVARQKIGGSHLTFGIVGQQPVMPPRTYLQPCPWSVGASVGQWIVPRAAELACTSDDMRPLGDALCMSSISRWSAERRFQIRCELDAAFFHLYGLCQDEINHVMETFSILKRKDEAQFGEYRTKVRIMDEYDRLGGAVTA